MIQAPISSRPRPTAKFAKYYAGAWTVLAAVALTYMIALALQPAMMSELVASPSEAPAVDNQKVGFALRNRHQRPEAIGQ